ncbi:MAG: YbgC/FadM family acyl-CoA thioesterase [Helicobacteraceae bacterium]|jgi:acyl-CoA thioester hydrolase|nr:YbgC/FadM family acyl-CoA thioesterase [Helicobacteraceae bacterium]
MTIRVYYEDTDALGVVYHANYIKYIERARSESFFAINRTPHSEEFNFVVRTLNTRFIKSAKLADLLTVKTALRKVGGASIWLDQVILRDDEPIFRAEVELAFIKNGKPARFTPEAKELLSQTLFRCQ